MFIIFYHNKYFVNFYLWCQKFRLDFISDSRSDIKNIFISDILRDY